MRLRNFVEESQTERFKGLMILLETMEINEMSDETFQAIKRLGKKMGFRVKKSDTLFDYIKRAGKNMEDLLRLATLYGMTDIKDRETRKELTQDMKDTFKKVNKRDLAAFLLQLDRGVGGLTAIPRHVLMSLFGIEVATQNTWLADKEYLEKEFRHIKKVLKRMGAEKELKDAEALEKKILALT